MMLVSTLLWVAVAQASRSPSTIKKTPVIGSATPQGCYRSSPIANPLRTAFNSPGYCTDVCLSEKQPVAILRLDECSCSDVYPRLSDSIADDECDYPCPGYALDGCGSSGGAYSVWNTGLELRVSHFDSETEKPSDEPSEESDLSDAIMGIASGVWGSGQEAAHNIMANICTYFDCASKRDSRSIADSEKGLKDHAE